MNYKRKKPRTQSRSNGVCPNGNPAWWNIIHHSRPRRRHNKRACRDILRGKDTDNTVWEMGNSKPLTYYW